MAIGMLATVSGRRHNAEHGRRAQARRASLHREYRVRTAAATGVARTRLFLALLLQEFSPPPWHATHPAIRRHRDGLLTKMELGRRAFKSWYCVEEAASS